MHCHNWAWHRQLKEICKNNLALNYAAFGISALNLVGNRDLAMQLASVAIPE